MNMLIWYVIKGVRGTLLCSVLFMIYAIPMQCMAHPQSNNPMNALHGSYMQGVSALQHMVRSCVGLSALSAASMGAVHTENQVLKKCALVAAAGSGIYSIWHGWAAMRDAFSALRPKVFSR